MLVINNLGRAIVRLPRKLVKSYQQIQAYLFIGVVLTVCGCPQDIKKRYCLTIIALWDTTFPSNRIVIFGLYQIV
jgi:hypothetical protein